MEKAGQILDGTAFEEKIIASYKSLNKVGAVSDINIFIVENKNSEQSLIFTVKKYPMMKIRASFPNEDGIIYISSLEYLAGSTHGWNEYTLDLIGTGILDLENSILDIEEIETVQISKGKIHRYDTRITGNDALTALRNRRDRILALVDWINLTNIPAAQNLNDFEKYWKPVLFPEILKKKNKPEGWEQAGDIYQKAESIKWNISYTERVFSEELWPVRNSGTMLRDWEEALSWIYLEYEWENIIALFCGKTIFENIK